MKAIKSAERVGEEFNVMAMCAFCNRKQTVLACLEEVGEAYKGTFYICKTCAQEAIDAIDKFCLDNFKSDFDRSRSKTLAEEEFLYEGK